MYSTSYSASNIRNQHHRRSGRPCTRESYGGSRRRCCQRLRNISLSASSSAALSWMRRRSRQRERREPASDGASSSSSEMLEILFRKLVTDSLKRAPIGLLPLLVLAGDVDGVLPSACVRAPSGAMRAAPRVRGLAERLPRRKLCWGAVSQSTGQQAETYQVCAKKRRAPLLSYTRQQASTPSLRRVALSPLCPATLIFAHQETNEAVS